MLRDTRCSACSYTLHTPGQTETKVLGWMNEVPAVYKLFTGDDESYLDVAREARWQAIKVRTLLLAVPIVAVSAITYVTLLLLHSAQRSGSDAS